MVQIGEESGALDAMCAKVADFYEAEVDALVDTLSSLLEPLIMSVLGVLVGGLVVAMYLPIFKLGQAISRSPSLTMTLFEGLPASPTLLVVAVATPGTTVHTQSCVWGTGGSVRVVRGG